MLSLSPRQLCDYYLDGNIEAAFEVFEHAGPQGLQQFLGIEDMAVWGQVYPVVLKEYGLLEQLCHKYRPYLAELIQEQGIPTFRMLLQIEGFEYNDLVNTLFSTLDPRGSRVLAYARTHSQKLWEIAQTQGTDELKKELGFSGLSSTQIDQVWEAVLDELLDGYMRNVFHSRQRNQVSTFFINLRNILRRDLGL